MTKKETTKKKQGNKSDDNAVFIGKRPTMNYVMAVMMVLNNGTNCVVKARGKSISHAVDVCEILKNRFLKGTTYGTIKITTEQLAGREDPDKTNNVSSMEIELIPSK